jgi:hypothetical protein
MLFISSEAAAIERERKEQEASIHQQRKKGFAFVLIYSQMLFICSEAAAIERERKEQEASIRRQRKKRFCFLF